MVEVADVNKDHVISYEEFVGAYGKTEWIRAQGCQLASLLLALLFQCVPLPLLLASLLLLVASVCAELLLRLLAPPRCCCFLIRYYLRLLLATLLPASALASAET